MFQGNRAKLIKRYMSVVLLFFSCSQGPRGSMFPPADVADGRFGLAADEGGASAPPPPRAVDIFINALAVSACVLGPVMAITGLR